jgi:hypothetical protein
MATAPSASAPMCRSWLHRTPDVATRLHTPALTGRGPRAQCRVWVLPTHMHGFGAILIACVGLELRWSSLFPHRLVHTHEAIAPSAIHAASHFALGAATNGPPDDLFVCHPYPSRWSTTVKVISKVDAVRLVPHGCPIISRCHQSLSVLTGTSLSSAFTPRCTTAPPTLPTIAGRRPSPVCPYC